MEWKEPGVSLELVDEIQFLSAFVSARLSAWLPVVLLDVSMSPCVAACLRFCLPVFLSAHPLARLCCRLPVFLPAVILPVCLCFCLPAHLPAHVPVRLFCRLPVSLPSLHMHAGSLSVPLGAVLAVCWAIAKQSWVYLAVAFISPILVSQIRPIAGARAQYGVSPCSADTG